MTALAKYQRLECTGLWRPSAAAQMREVIVGLRDATLVLTDPKTAMARSHWSLPSVERINPNDLPALFTAGRLDDGTPGETLELDDPDMIAALDTVRVVLNRRRAHPGRLRGLIVVAVLTLVGCFGALWLPGAMIRHTAAVLPVATRVQIGKMALQDLIRLTGSPCSTPLGTRAAATLAQHLSSAGVGEIDVLRDGVAAALALPGGIVLLNRKLVEQEQDAEPAAGYALAETLRAATADPVIPALRYAGMMATFRLLTTGVMPQGALDGYAEGLLTATPAPLDQDRLLERFRAANLSSTAYARALDPTGEATLTLIEADPFKGRSPVPILDDRNWISLQGICSG